ncbi:MIP aquaporin-like protein [Aureococcus anophagefferens]|nr:MIP aquaporin-like protein [Aureococcus anophagefferens]
MDLVEDCYGYACKGPVAAAIILCLVAAPIGQGKSLVKAWWNECYGAAIMIAATFSPGKWWGVAGTVLEPAMHPALAAIDAIVPLDWVCHWLGVAAADYSCGGPHVNPGVSMAMCCIGKIPWAQFATRRGPDARRRRRVPGAPDARRAPRLDALGGPAVDAAIAGDAPEAAPQGRKRVIQRRFNVLHEFGATLLLCLGVFAICLESPFKDIYPLKITCVAALIRFLIVYLGAARPAINPMLATTWALYATGSFPTFYQHCLVYWAAPLAAAVTAGFVYALLKSGATFFGVALRGGAKKAAPKKKKA